jgi:undecaprenyl-diphosphatase
MDIQWLGNATDLAEHLRARGWRTPRLADLSRFADLFNSKAKLGKLPVLPQVHRGETQQVLLVRDLEDTPRLLALRLWETGQHAANNPSTRLWAGTVTYLYVEDRLRLFRFLRTDVDFDSPLRRFAQDTLDLGQRWVQRPIVHHPAARFQWNGSVLLLYDPRLNSSASNSW